MILEYSEKQKAFHFNYGRNKPNTNGYFTIAENIDDMTASKFTRVIYKKYRNLPELAIIRLEWMLFNIL